jgi:hypothetical protein
MSKTMRHEVKIIEPTDLWYLQNNINKETNKYYHPTKDIPFVQQLVIYLNNSGAIIQKGALHWCMGQMFFFLTQRSRRKAQRSAECLKPHF